MRDLFPVSYVLYKREVGSTEIPFNPNPLPLEILRWTLKIHDQKYAISPASKRGGSSMP